MSIFLKIAEVPGESTAKGFEQMIECSSYSHGVSQAATATQSGSLGDANCHHQDVTITKLCDSASPLLAQNCAEAKNFPEVTISITKTVANQQIAYFVVTLTDCIISMVSMSGSDEGAPIESVSINFAKITWNYTSVDKTGTVGGTTEGGWDLTTGAVPS
ncbi:MAG: type VI secretion system tube protein Hcp [bacterium]